MFTNPTIQSTITQLNGNSLYLVGFGMYSTSSTTYYYVIDYNIGKVYILNDEWSFISFKTFNVPYNMISIGNSLYIIGDTNVWKVDQDLNILINYNSGYAVYRGISYNPANGLIYVPAYRLKEIQVFSLDLTMIRSFSTSPHYPFSITVSSNKLYVGTQGGGIILVYQNEKIINQFNGCNGNSDIMMSIYLDQNGYMATTCLSTNKLYLLSPNGSYIAKSITTPSDPRYIGFDSKGRFVQISTNQISIYK